MGNETFDRRTCRRRSLLGGLLTVAVARHAPPARARAASVDLPTASCPKVVVPAYIRYEEEGAWRTLATTPAVGLVVVNPQSGPGAKRLAAIAEQVRAVQHGGAQVLGYVRTALGARPKRKVVAEIRRYAAWYGVDGIYLDEVHNMPRLIPYYRSLAAAIRRDTGNGGDAGFVMLNPGYVPAEGYLAFADVIETYEWYYNRYAKQSFPAWVNDYPSHRFAHVIHDVPDTAAALETALRLARQRNAGYVFVTDRSHPRQYAGLPRFWSAKMAALCG